MTLTDLIFPTPEENLACDEALLEWCEEEPGMEILRLWEPLSHFIVLGYACHVQDDVNLGAARSRGIPVLRRYSGGGTVVQGPGCLNYSLILRIRGDGPLSTIGGTTAFVMGRTASALQTLTREKISIAGHSDLSIEGRKFSGNAQRRIRRCLLFHGTILTRLDFALVDDLLNIPIRQPSYRQNRTHSEFLRTFPASAEAIRSALQRTWAAGSELPCVPLDAIARLVRTRYGSDAWTFRR